MEKEPDKPIFEKILDDLIAGEKGDSSKTQKAFAEALKYFHKLNEILKSGTEKEKKQAMDEFIILKRKIARSVERLKESTGLSEEEIQTALKNPAHYKQEDWQVIEESLDEIKSMKELSQNIKKHYPHEKEKPKKKKDKWIKS